MIDIHAHPRAVAALVALREPRNRVCLRDALADVSTETTLDLLGRMRDWGLVCQKPGSVLWYLAPAGIEWLRLAGIEVQP